MMLLAMAAATDAATSLEGRKKPARMPSEASVLKAKAFLDQHPVFDG